MKLNIQNKLLLSFIIILVMTGVVGYIGFSSMSTINNNLTDMYNKQTVSLSDIKQASMDINGMRVALFSAILENDPTAIETETNKIRDYDARFKAEIEEFEKRINSPEISQMTFELKKILQ